MTPKHLSSTVLCAYSEIKSSFFANVTKHKPIALVMASLNSKLGIQRHYSKLTLLHRLRVRQRRARSR